MTTVPPRFAKVAIQSHTLEHARARTISAYRTWLRSAPEICQIYSLNVPPSMVRLKIRQDFERNRHVENLGVINMLLHKNQQEYQETMNQWKQEPHVEHWFKHYEDPPQPVAFLDKFYAGRDDPSLIEASQRTTA
ncbi:hypothetical protein BD324DRAFT_629026 [Kockovaella imperatae]|uniref:NADH dehydrogenase, alpha subcomplex, subunit 6 n=1 Tax=Kockovaella imperatae TaxID=4999 RepID=A0A1Y1UG23_9TREE|nr:hypothetical protein BD324DRAFT_629026 [Kockovaella imperatae]ORX36487.1 hypothetical protein BD324DRAFT_629026 [Kockovaella imperatae]